MPRSALDNDKVRVEIEKLLEIFKKPDSLEFVAKSFFRRGADLPSDGWSNLNRLIMLSNGTSDARTFNQFKEINRYPKKGSKAFYIFAPLLVPEKDKDGHPVLDKNGKPKVKLIGYKTIPEFRVEDTDGEPVDYKPSAELPRFCGTELAEKWGITVKQGYENPSYYAMYSHTKKEIVCATPCQQDFFHELVHAADDKISGGIKGGQDPAQEIVADFSSAVLMGIFGLKAGTKNTYDYVKSYANQLGKDDAIEAIIPLIGKISKLINLIIKESDELCSKEQKN